MGIIIIDPPEKPKAAAALSDEDWAAVWRYCCAYTQAKTRIEERRVPPDHFTAQAKAFAAFVIGLVCGGMGAIAAIFAG